MFSFRGIELKPISLSDAWRICDFAVANSDRLKRYFPKTLEQNLNPTLSKVFVEKKVNQFNNKEEYLFVLKHAETRNIIGLVYLKELDWEKKQGEFAYCIHYGFVGKGIITEAVHSISNYALNDLGLKKLQIIVHKENTSSIKVALNTNFRWIQTLEKEFTPTGEKPLDMELYEKHD